jgi:hypothetical protein
MSPFIRRDITDEPEPSAGKITTPHEFYVPRKDLQHGDIVLDPFVTDFNSRKFIRDEVLAGLAVQFPKEFAEAAAKRGIATGTTAADDGDETDPDEDGDGGDGGLEAAAKRAVEVVNLNAEQAVAAIKGIDDPDVLAAIRELEEAREAPRSTVLKALDAKEQE